MLNDVRLVLYFGTGEGKLAAPEGPGWYLFGTRPRNGGVDEIIPHVRLTSEEAVQFAKVVDRFTNGKPLNFSPGEQNPGVSLEGAVVEANAEARAFVQREVEEAERQIRNLEILRARAKEFGVDESN